MADKDETPKHLFSTSPGTNAFKTELKYDSLWGRRPDF